MVAGRAITTLNSAPARPHAGSERKRGRGQACRAAADAEGGGQCADQAGRHLSGESPRRVPADDQPRPERHLQAEAGSDHGEQPGQQLGRGIRSENQAGGSTKQQTG